MVIDYWLLISISLIIGRHKFHTVGENIILFVLLVMMRFADCSLNTIVALCTRVFNQYFVIRTHHQLTIFVNHITEIVHFVMSRQTTKKNNKEKLATQIYK